MPATFRALTMLAAKAAVRSGETKPSLAKRFALAKSESDRGSNAVHQHIFAASDGVAETEPGAIGSREMRAVFRLEGVGYGSELGLVTHLRSVSLNDEIQ